MENFAPLGGLMLRLHEEFVHLYYISLPVFFMLAIAIDWIKDPGGTPDFVGTLKRAIISTLLVAGFQEIADLILALTSGIANHISDLSGIDAFYAMALQKIKSYHFNPVVSVLMARTDWAMAILSFASYVLVYWARYVIIAIYHFMWTFLCILGPILILFNLFRGTAQVTINLFRGLVEVASYKIVWAILSAMLMSLPFGQAYQADGGYLTVIVLNFVIALAMLATPLIVHSVIGSGVTSLGQTLATGTAAAMLAAPTRLAGGVSFSLDAFRNPKGFAQHALNQFKPKGRFDYASPPKAPAPAEPPQAPPPSSPMKPRV